MSTIKRADQETKEETGFKNISDDLALFIKKLPKAELHVHVDGTLEAELMFEMAQRNKVSFPYKSIEETRAAYKFNNLQEFLNLYFLGAGVMQKEQDFYDLTYAYLEKAHRDGIHHTEMFVGPQTHTWKPGVTVDTVMDGTIRAMDDAMKKLGITSQIIVDFNRSHVNDPSLIGKPGWAEQAAKDAPADAKKTYQALQDYLARKPDNKGYVVGFGLDYAEVGFPPIWFKELFTQIRSDGYKTVAHAGEEGPAEYVWQAIRDLGVTRIDHGNRSTEDRELLQHLKNSQIPLTMCPLSNLALCVVKDLKDHPLKKLLDLGVKATVNSDDPAYFGGYMNKNFIAIAEALNLNMKDLCTLARNSFEASFLAPDQKKALVDQVDNYYHKFTETQKPKTLDESDANRALLGIRELK